MKSKAIRGRTCALALVCLLWTASTAEGGIGVAKQFAISNAGFDSGLTGWSRWSSDGLTHLNPSSGPSGGRTSVRCNLPSGEQASLTHNFSVVNSSTSAADVIGSAASGEKVEFGAWVYLGSDCTSGEVYVQVNSFNGFSTTTIAESDPVKPATDIHGQWLYVHTKPITGFDARIPQGATSFSVVLRVNAPGTVWFDEVQGGAFEYAEFGLVDASFEDPGLFAANWSTQGTVTLNPPAESGAYYGDRFLQLSGSGLASVSQTLEVRDGRASPAPGESTEACAWVYVENDALLGALPSARLWVRLKVFAWTPGTPLSSAVELASAQWNPSSTDRRVWTFLQTQPGATPQIPFDKTHLLVEVEKSFDGTARIDFVQAGERFSVNGNPRKHVACSYVGWYRSPLFPGTTTTPTNPSAIWRNWCWTSPPACDQNYSQLAHDPDCATSSQCFRVNSRRNGSTSVETSIDQLPLAGTYDSRDPAVLGYHVKLAHEIGIDSFIFDYQGHELAQQIVSQGGEAINEQTFESLLDATEDQGSDFKISVMYEPKVHFLGWVQNEPTLALKQLGIEADLTYLLAAYSKRRCMLKYDGRLVVYVFRNTTCNPAGTQCLDDARWKSIKDHVELATGLELCLVADAEPTAPPSSNAFNGMSRWSLLSLDLMRYQTFSEFIGRQSSWPQPTSQTLVDHASAVDASDVKWAAVDDSSRFSVALAWPGFDDSGVAGWSSNNLTGRDGQPLCVRIASDLGGAFHSLTWSAAIDSGADWIQIVTWNDWNEGTQIEPSWNVSYSQSALSGTVPSQTVLEQVFGRAFEAQSAIAMFKGLRLGVDLLPSRIDAVTTEYLRAAAFTPGVTPYD